MMKFVVPGTRIRGCSIIRRTSICAGLLNRFFSRRLKSRRNFCETEPPRYHFHSPEGGEKRVKERGREVLFQSFALRFDNGREKKKKKKNIKIDSSHRSLIRHDLINPRLEISSARFLPYFVFRVSTLLDLVSVYKSCESSE